jgi:hypothetical protein
LFTGGGDTHNFYSWTSDNTDMKIVIETVLGVIIVLIRFAGLHTAKMPVYKEHRLDVLCSPQGQKHKVSLGKQPAVFTFNVFNERTFQCHLELQLLSEDFGFYVFIDKLWLDKTPGCGGDFLQFGRQVIHHFCFCKI